MKKTITLTESELIKLIEDTAREHKKDSEKSLDPNFDNKIKKVAKRYGKLFEMHSKSSDHRKFEAWKNETRKLIRQGYSDTILGEALTVHTNLLTEISFMGGSTSWIREGLWNWVLGLLGVEDGRMKIALSATLGNVPFWDIPKLLKCDYLVGVLTSGMVDFLGDEVGRFIGGAEEGEQTGQMNRFIRNIFAETMETTAMKQKIDAYLRDMVCGALSGKKEKVEKLMGDEKTKDKDKVKKEPGSKQTGWGKGLPDFMGGDDDSGTEPPSGSTEKAWYDEILKGLTDKAVSSMTTK